MTYTTKLFGGLLGVVAFMLSLSAQAQPTSGANKRALWASINTKSDASTGDYKSHNNKLLLSWRALPTDGPDMTYHLYRRIVSSPTGPIYRVTSADGVSNSTCFQTTTIPSSATVYYLLPGDYFPGGAPSFVSGDEDKSALQAAALDSFAVGANIYRDKLPYLSIPLKGTDDVCAESDIVYQANDCSVGDLDGDGEMEIVVKRLLTTLDAKGNVISDGTGGGDSDPRARHCVVFDAYKLDGTMLWRVKSGPNIILGNSSNFAVADLDGDGCAEVVTKTGEGTVFGDGYEIPDTDGDGKTDYRDVWPAGHYTGDGPKGYGGPEFFSVIDGKTGRELARANFIARAPEGQTPAEWAANWYENDWKWDPRTSKYQWKLANSLRLGVACFTGKGMQIFMGRGVYGRTIVEGWQYDPTPSDGFEGTLTRLWKIDTDDAGGSDKNKDGKSYSAYGGQGNHAFNVADLDGDGFDEVMYGSCAWDHDGTGLWTTGLGHGDAAHVGKFLPERDGLQVYHCLETGKTQVALHDARDGSIIWQKVDTQDGDMGRCMVADIDPNSPGCEFWMYGNWVYSQTGAELGYSTGSCNMGIWFDGTLTRQLIDGDKMDGSLGRTFTLYRYDISYNNGSKKNPGWYGDFLGDWREEIIMPSADKLTDIKIFSTWYPTTHKFPWLMTDHTYYMQCIHQQVGYNQPNNLGYYLGTDLKNDAEGWEAAAKVDEAIRAVTGIEPVVVQPSSPHTPVSGIYNMMGQKVTNPRGGIFIKNGKKVIIK